MSPKLRPPPKSKQSKPPKTKQTSKDSDVSQNSTSATVNTPAANNDPSLGSAFAKDDLTAPLNQLSSQIGPPLLPPPNQEDGAQPVSEKNNAPCQGGRTWGPYRKRSAEDDGSSSQPARKRRYNPARGKAAKFKFPVEIIRLIFRCLISEHQTFKSDFCSAVCFALTSRRHREIFRSIHSAKVSLRDPAPGTRNLHKDGLPYLLGDLLIDWMLPTYRPMLFHHQDAIALYYIETIDVFISNDVYSKKGGAKEKRLAQRMKEHQRNLFSQFHSIYHALPLNTLKKPSVLNWFVPNPYRMGEEWYAATARFLKHTIFKWKSDCHTEKEYHWLRDSEEYSHHYHAWAIYKGWMLRDWVEAQPEAKKYKKSRGLGKDKSKVGMRDGFEMLKLVDVRSEEHKRKVREVGNAMLRAVKSRPLPKSMKV
ncbi:hypothetical protein EAE96_004424 [Botrytis aclada]|nr:hypothetical protein EAE96_004424 [Botrytis aclada]